MTLKSYLTIMIITNFLCWIVWLFVIKTVNPEITNYLGFFFFYASLFLALSGLSAIIGFLIRFVFLKHELVLYSVKTAFRQSFLLSFLIVASLFLLSHELFTWFNLILLIAALSILEFFLLSCSSIYKKN